MKQVYNIDLQNQQFFKKAAEIKAFWENGQRFVSSYAVKTSKKSLSHKREEGYVSLQPHISSKQADALTSLSATQKRIINIALSKADHSGEFIISQFEWALAAGISRSYLQKQLKELERWGYIASRYRYKQESVYKLAQSLLSKQSRNKIRIEIKSCLSEYEALNNKNINIFNFAFLKEASKQLRACTRVHEKVANRNAAALPAAKIKKEEMLHKKDTSMKDILDQLGVPQAARSAFEQLPLAAVKFALKRITAKRMAGQQISNIASLALHIAKEEATKIAAASAEDKKKAPTEAERLAKIVNRQYDSLQESQKTKEYTADDLPALKKKVDSYEKYVALSSQTYDKYPTEQNMRWLQRYDRELAHWREVYQSTLAKFPKQPQQEEPIQYRNAQTDAYAESLGKLMPNHIKDQILLMKANGDPNPQLKNNPVLDKILKDYMASKKATIIIPTVEKIPEELHILDNDEEWEEIL